MEHDDGVRDEGTPEPADSQSGPRRSNYTPPTSPQPVIPGFGDGTDDDALADALAADLSRIASGPIGIITPDMLSRSGLATAADPILPDGVASAEPAEPAGPAGPAQPYEQAEAASPYEQAAPSEAAAPEPAAPAEPMATPEPEAVAEVAGSAEPAAPAEPTPSAEPVASREPFSSFVDDAPTAPPASVFVDNSPTAEVPVQPLAPTPLATPDLSSFPAPDPSQAVPLAADPPVRRSMPDDELSRWVAEASDRPGGTLEVIEQLQNQMKLREVEARELRAWEDRMRAFPDGTPPVPVAEAGESEPREPSESTQEPADSAATPPLEDTVPASSLPTSSLPAWGIPAPSPAWAPPPEWDDASATPPPLVSPEALAQAPAPAASTRAPFDWSPTGPIASVPQFTAPVPDVAEEQGEDDQQAPRDEPAAADEVDAAGAPEVAPEPEAVESGPFAGPLGDADPADPTSADAVIEPTIDPEEQSEPGLQPEPELVLEPEPEPEQEPELVPEPEPEFIPEPEPTLEPEPTPEPEPEPTIAPPPLIEPTLGTSPLRVSAPLATPTPDPFDIALAGADEPAESVDDEPEPGERGFDWTLPAPAVAPVGTGDLSAEEPPRREDPAPLTPAPEPLFIEPMPVSAGESIPTDTGSITVIDQAYDEDLDDDVDETDRAFADLLGPIAVGATGVAATQISPPSGPISTVRIPADEQVLFDDEPVAQRVFSIEQSDIEPTPVDHRVGRAARLFWLWFAANSSILSLGLGAAVFAVGMSLRQSIVAILAGVALSFLPLGLSTLAGKRSGQPTMIVSRATFGLLGNIVPAVIALVSRVFWGAVLLWLLASSVAVVLVGADLEGPVGEQGILLISLAAAFLVAVLVAFAGYPLFARIQLILSIISAVLVVGLIALTYQYIDIPQALTAADGPWLITVTGAVLVFSVVGLVWAHSGADLARYQRTDSSGASSMLWATFGTTIPTFLLIGYGALLAASDEGIASGFLLSPLDTLALMLPAWYPVPLVAATALSLLSGVILSLYSGGFALQSIGVRVKRQWSVFIVAALLGGLSLLLGFGIAGGLSDVLRDMATTLAVPTAAWVGIFAAETMIRNRRFEGQSLVQRGGVYADVRWVNLTGLVVFTVIGFGFTTAAISWLSWQGYGFSLLGIGLDTDLAGTDLGVLVALVLGLLLPIVAGIPAIRKQEAMRV